MHAQHRRGSLDLTMHVRYVRTFEEWRVAARPLLLGGFCADEIHWRVPLPGEEVPPGTSGNESAEGESSLRLPRALVRLLEAVSHYRHDARWELMYRLAWRTLYENRRLIEDEADPDVRNATLMARAVDRECHKMHAFVRFREVRGDDGAEAYFAWFEPEHEILRRAVPFFARRFPNMRWTIATPDGAVACEDGQMRFIDAPPASERPQEDVLEPLWRTYYRSICNVARIAPGAMQREMPKRYWHNLPETTEIPGLVRDGAALFEKRHREGDESSLSMARAVRSALARLPSPAAGPATCRRCHLWRNATQAVFGEGPVGAHLMLVGEQPGDEEDLRGHAFVGPAGRVLDEALTAAGIERGAIFITNAVKHFKWEPRGKRRLHRRPDVREISACNLWLRGEIETVRPQVIVALGATALRALTGASAPIESSRGKRLAHASGATVCCTYHPSAILRAEAPIAERMRRHLVEDLREAATLRARSGLPEA